MNTQTLLFAPPPPASITKHELWEKLLPYVRVEADGPKRVRLEVKGLPRELALEALEMTVGCCECRRPIHPVRTRRAPNKRNENLGGRFFLAVACPLAVSIGCSRGHAASAEYERIQSHVYALEMSQVVAP